MGESLRLIGENAPLRITGENPSMLRIGHRTEPLVTIRPDGSLEYGENYHPDEAAGTFWAAVSRYGGNHVDLTRAVGLLRIIVEAADSGRPYNLAPMRQFLDEIEAKR